MADTADSPLWYETFDDVFWLTVSGSFFAFMAVVLRACLKSRCTSISMCGLNCKRDLDKDVDTNDIRLNIETPKTPNSMSDFSEMQEGRDI